MACSQCEGIESTFGRAEARRKLRSYRRRGPDRTTRLLIAALRDALNNGAPRSATLLDIGAGIGAIHHELLDGVVKQVVHLDASTAHLEAAREETERLGHTDRVSFIHGDFAAEAGSIAPADIVTLDRVICCYHDMDRLVSLSSDKAGQLYGAVYPREASWVRIGIAAVNLVQRIKGSGFRVYLHAPTAIDAILRTNGLARRVVQRTFAWEVVVYERAANRRAVR